MTFPPARLLDAAGVDCILVGDSLGTVVQGWETTLRVTIDQIIYHAEMVARAAQRALVVADLPFLSYQVSPQQAMQSAGRILKETNCQAVKLEGGRKMAATIKALVDAEIPVMGHVACGRRPSGGWAATRFSARPTRSWTTPWRSPNRVRSPSCSSASPASWRPRSPRRLPIPTIGIGAGPHCDGQVLVFHDMLGLFEGFRPKFVRQYADLGSRSGPPSPATSPTSGKGAFPANRRVFARQPDRPTAPRPTRGGHPMNTTTQEELPTSDALPAREGCRRSLATRPRRWPATSKGWALDPDGRTDLAILDGEELHGRQSSSSTRWPPSPKRKAITPTSISKDIDRSRSSLWTHAVGGLTENDFILAAKINQVPVELQKRPAKSK